MLQIPNSLIAYSIIKIIGNINHKEIFSKINEIYLCEGKKKIIRILSILKDESLIRNLSNFILCIEKDMKNSTFKSVKDKVNNPKIDFVSNHKDI